MVTLCTPASLSLLLPLFLWAISNVKQGYGQFPAVELNAPPKAYKTMWFLQLTKHHWLVMNTVTALANSQFFHLSSLHIITHPSRETSQTLEKRAPPNWTLSSKRPYLCSLPLLYVIVPFLMRTAWFCNPALFFSYSFWYQNKALQARQETGGKFTKIQLPFIYFFHIITCPGLTHCL